MKLYRAPLTSAYWHEASQSAKNLKNQVFAALMIAASIALGLVPGIPIFHTELTFSYLARSLAALTGGPILGSLYGLAEDLLGYVLNPKGEFFFGYTLSTVLGVLVYALCFYRARITVWRIVLAHTLVNLLVNALLGSVWVTMLRHGNYWHWFTLSLVKNVLTILPKSLLQYLLFQSLLPILQGMGLIPAQVAGRLRKQA